MRQRVEHADARRIAQRANVSAQIGHVVAANQRVPQLGDAGGVEVDDVAERRRGAERISERSCSYVQKIPRVRLRPLRTARPGLEASARCARRTLS